MDLMWPIYPRLSYCCGTLVSSFCASHRPPRVFLTRGTNQVRPLLSAEHLDVGCILLDASEVVALLNPN
jgi:hypothetical protein